MILDSPKPQSGDSGEIIFLPRLITMRSFQRESPVSKARARQACAILIAASLSFSSAGAEIFKCVEGGKTSYQDQPCRGSASAISVAPADTKGISTVTAGEDSLSRLKAQIDEMARERRKREIANEVGRLERDIGDYEQAENTELAALRDKKGYNYHNLAAAAWQREWVLKNIDGEMQSVTEKYRTLKQAARDRVSVLRKEAAEIGRPR
jgi:Domain of unknown function (DUF4124)